MSIATLLPIRGSLFDRARTRKPRHPQHRAVDEIERQKTLRAGADLLIKGLRLQLQDQEAAHAEIVARIDARHAEVVQGLEQQIADLERRLDVSSRAEAAVTKTQPIPTFFAATKLASTSPARVPAHPVPVITRVEPAEGVA